jgi:hypothetical protein
MRVFPVHIERKINKNGDVELWRCEWENPPNGPAKKVFLSKIGDEPKLQSEESTTAVERSAICWSYGRTLGNIAVIAPTLLGKFSGTNGDDAILPCDLVYAGKFRHGAERWWCRTHQTHWGTKADIKAFEQNGEMMCANHHQRMHYVVAPKTINVVDYAEVGIWCSMPAALSTVPIKPRPPRIHVHVRPEADGKKTVDADYSALAVLYSASMGLFSADTITRVNITPPAAFEFVCSLELQREMDCINCSHCGYPHLDLGDFATKPHRKHFCGNCGRDSTWSKKDIVSTPLKPLHDQFAHTVKYVTPERTLNLDEYSNCTYTVWASTPAIIWSAKREQEFGIHVHVHNGEKRIIDDTFGTVILDGKPLERSKLILAMIENSVV